VEAEERGEALMKIPIIFDAKIIDAIPDIPHTQYNNCEFINVDFADTELFRNSFSNCRFINCIGIPKRTFVFFRDCRLIKSPELAGFIVINHVGYNCDLNAKLAPETSIA
jgi:uncharacterized protein YjbI with pentapeptide repeats